MTGPREPEPANHRAPRTAHTVRITPECSARSFGFNDDGWPGLVLEYEGNRLTFDAGDDLKVAERFAKDLAYAALGFGSRCQSIMDGRRG